MAETSLSTTKNAKSANADVAHDCGQIVNPDGTVYQIEGGAMSGRRPVPGTASPWRDNGLGFDAALRGYRSVTCR